MALPVPHAQGAHTNHVELQRAVAVRDSLMPLFEFECPHCGSRIECLFVSAKRADEAEILCHSPACLPVTPSTAIEMQRIVSTANFALKGVGFHCVDYADKK